MRAKLNEFTVFIHWMEPFWGVENISWSPECEAKTDLMNELSYIVLSVLVHLTDTVPKHNGQKQNFIDHLVLE